MDRVFAIASVAVCLMVNLAVAQRGERSDSNRNERRDDDSRSRNDRRNSAAEISLTPGFGETTSLPAVLGFGLNATDTSGRLPLGVPLADRYHERVIAYVDQVLRRYDRNRNGQLERNESTSARWRSDPASSDLNQDGILTREELCERVATYDEFRGLNGSAASSAGANQSPASDRAKLDEYARGLIQRYDRNDNGVLEADEFQAMSSFHRGADANGDGVITRDELADRLASYGSSGGRAGRDAASGERSRDDRSASASSSSKRYPASGERSSSRGIYRIRSAAERLPRGLPDWFTRNDADGDGQISMAEFAVSWTDDKLDEFRSYDANGDGVITPQECLSDRPSQSVSEPAEKPRFGRSWGR